MSGADLVLCDISDGVATVTLNRPEKLNALSRELYGELDAILAKLDRDDAVRAVVLTGAGRAFSAGADLSGPGGAGLKDRWAGYEGVNARQLFLWDMGKPVIAAVHGYCLGRGCELALWCDIVFASEDAKIGQPEIRDGSIVASIIPWLIGMQQAKLFMLSGDMLPAREAERIGLITRCVGEGMALEESLKLARRLAHLPGPAARAVKRMINGVYELQGIRSAQANGVVLSTVFAGLSPAEKELEHLEEIRRERGFKAYVEARDAPFRE